MSTKVLSNWMEEQKGFSANIAGPAEWEKGGRLSGLISHHAQELG